MPTDGDRGDRRCPQAWRVVGPPDLPARANPGSDRGSGGIARDEDLEPRRAGPEDVRPAGCVHQVGRGGDSPSIVASPLPRRIASAIVITPVAGVAVGFGEVPEPPLGDGEP